LNYEFNQNELERQNRGFAESHGMQVSGMSTQISQIYADFKRLEEFRLIRRTSISDKWQVTGDK